MFNNRINLKNYRKIFIKVSRPLSAVFLISVTFCLPTLAHANLITFAYEGVVDNIFFNNISDTTPFDTLLGNTIRIEYTFDSELADTQSVSTIGTYSPLSAAQLSIGGNSYTPRPITLLTGSSIIIYDNHLNRDDYAVSVKGSMLGPAVGDLELSRFGVGLSSFDTSVFNSTALPLVQPDVSDFSNGGVIRLTFSDGIGGSSVTIDASNPQIASVVPVPAAVWLFGSGLISLIGVARRKTRA